MCSQQTAPRHQGERAQPPSTSGQPAPARPAMATNSGSASAAIPVPRALASLRARLGRRYNLGTTAATVAGRSWQVLGPADPDSLIDSALENDDDRLPYWSQLWPSGVVLADAVLEGVPGRLAGRRVLELGCGLGLTAAAALVAGGDVVATDSDSDALLFAAYNALALAGRPLATRLINWRAADVASRLDPPYDVVLAADVLYERRNVAPLADLMPRLLAPGGSLWLADPRREAGNRFVARQAAAGWHDTVHAVPFVGLQQRVTVDLHRLTPP